MTPEQFLLFADPLPEPTLFLADDGLIFAGNRAVEERLGISVSWLQGKRLAEVVIESPDEVSHYLRLCSRSRSLVLGAMRLHINGSEEIACRMEGSVISPKQEGSAAVLLLRLMPKESAAGQFVVLNQRIEELGREVQRRKRAEVETRQREEWLQVTLHSIGDGVICTDAHGRVTMMNPVAEVLIGWTQDAAQGQLLAAVFPIINEQTRRPVTNPVEKVLRNGVVVGLANHTLLVARDGTERPIDDSAAPIRDESGKSRRRKDLPNVTELRRAEHELRSSEARKSAIFLRLPSTASSRWTTKARWLSSTRQRRRRSATAGEKS
ncbi:MAG: PAS domain-containing protein [Planctomycetaceae bacterium]